MDKEKLKKPDYNADYIIRALDHIGSRVSMYIGDDNTEKLECYLMGLWNGHYGFFVGTHSMRQATVQRGFYHDGEVPLITQLKNKFSSIKEVNKELCAIWQLAFEIEDEKFKERWGEH